MASNRFDQLLPLQLIPRESIYVPFRIKDNSEIYSKLFSSLGNKKGGVKLPDAKLYEGKVTTSDVSYQTSFSTAGESTSTFNLPFQELETIITKQNEALANQSLNQLMELASDGEVTPEALFLHNKKINELNNDIRLSAIRNAYSFYQEQLQKIPSNSETQGKNYKNIAVVQASLQRGVLLPNIPITAEDNKTFSSTLQDFISSAKSREKQDESALRTAHTLGIPNRMVLGGLTEVILYESEKITSEGSYYNRALTNIEQIGEIRKKMEQSEESYSFNELYNRKDILNTDVKRLYNNYGELLAFIETDVKNATSLFGNTEEYNAELMRYKSIAQKMKLSFAEQYKEYQFNEEAKKGFLSKLNEEFIAKLKLDGIDLTNLTGATIDKINYKLKEFIIEKQRELDKYVSENSNIDPNNPKVKEIRGRIDVLKNKFMDAIDMYENFQQEFLKHRGQVFNKIMQEGVVYEKDKDGNMVKREMTLLEKDITKAIALDDFYRNQKRQKNILELKTQLELYTNRSDRKSYNYGEISGRIPTEAERGGSGNNLNNRGLIFQYIPMADNFGSKRITSVNYLNFAVDAKGDLNKEEKKNLFGTILKLNDENFDKIKNVSFYSYRDNNGKIKLKVKGFKDSRITEVSEKDSLIAESEYDLRMENDEIVLLNPGTSEYGSADKSPTIAFTNILNFSLDTASNQNIENFKNEVKVMLKLDSILNDGEKRQLGEVNTAQEMFTRSIQPITENKSNTKSVFVKIIYKSDDNERHEVEISPEYIKNFTNYPEIKLNNKTYKYQEFHINEKIYGKNNELIDSNLAVVKVTGKKKYAFNENIGDEIRSILGYSEYSSSNYENYYIMLNPKNALRYLKNVELIRK